MPIKNFDSVIVDFEDKPLTLNSLQMTYKRAVIIALQSRYDDERQLSQEDSLNRFELSLRIKRGGDVELSHEDIVEIKKCVNKMFGPAVFGPISQLLKD